MIYTIIISALTALFILWGVPANPPYQTDTQPSENLGAFAPISVPAGGTGWATITPNTVLLGNSASRLATTTAGTNGQVLMLSNGMPGWYATSAVAGITSINSLSGAAQTITGSTGLNDTIGIISAGTDHKINLVQTATPAWTTIRATSTTASSTISWGLNVIQGISVGGTGTTTIRGDSASSTFGGGILANGTGNFTTGLILGGALNNTSAATSSFTGGITSAGLFSSSGLTITGGSILNTSTATSSWSGGLSLTTLNSSNLRITNTAHFKDGLISVVTSGSGVPITGIVDSSVATQNGLLIKNNTNFAHSGTLAQFSLLNGSDSGTIMSLNNSGTGRNLIIASSTSLEVFSISNRGAVAIGGTTTPNHDLTITGSAYTKEYRSPYASALDIDWSKANQQKLLLTGATTLTFRNGMDGGAYRLVACQDSTGGRVITWPATTTVSWAGRTGPSVAPKIADHCDVFSFIGTSATSSFMYFAVEALAF